MPRFLLCTSLLIIISAAACGGGIGDPAGGDAAGSAAACVGPLGPPITAAELTGMTACCQADMGQAHCLAAASTPAQLQGFVAACDSGGYCIPDGFLETGARRCR